MSFQRSNLALHTVAYKEAGDRLVDSIIRDRSFQRELILPISSLYRLYVELSLKQLIFLGNQLLIKPLEWKDKVAKLAGYPIIHALKDSPGEKALLTICKDILTQLAEESTLLNMSDLHFDVLEGCIHDFFGMDFTEDPFRYPNNTKGIPFLPDDYYVNVYQLRETISRVDVLCFDEALLAITDILQKQSEL
jgi:hypothetical protein